MSDINKFNKLVGINVDKPVKVVKHSKLKRSGDSAYRSVCPVCKVGVLLMRRGPGSGKLYADDNCILCGQPFEYSDIETLRKMEAN